MSPCHLLSGLAKLVILGLTCMGTACQFPGPRQPPPPAEPWVETTELPLEKVFNPAFVDEVANRWLRTTARFGGVIDTMLDLPPDVRTGHVRFSILPDGNSTSMGGMRVVIPKAKSDIVFELSGGERIEILAFAREVIITSTRTGAQERGVMLVVESVRRAE